MGGGRHNDRRGARPAPVLTARARGAGVGMEKADELEPHTAPL